METVKFSEDVRPVTDLKIRSAEIVAQVRRSRRPVLLTRRGTGVAVLMDLDEYEALVERASFVDAVRAGASAASGGDLHSDAEAARIFDSFGEADA
ncbi:MAG TPA: type II toxin-antitoxin system Phd/YefM family antitoxin [Polyangia bacterium]|nr:type II toxin-antitoxin system Phd/YefM family antitoxin [Polyangia bacterium]